MRYRFLAESGESCSLEASVFVGALVAVRRAGWELPWLAPGPLWLEREDEAARGGYAEKVSWPEDRLSQWLSGTGEAVSESVALPFGLAVGGLLTDVPARVEFELRSKMREVLSVRAIEAVSPGTYAPEARRALERLRPTDAYTASGLEILAVERESLLALVELIAKTSGFTIGRA